MNDDNLMEMLRKHAGQIAEHFDSVQILCTKLNSNGTTSAYRMGSGDFYARIGLAQRFIKLNDADDMAYAIACRLPPKD